MGRSRQVTHHKLYVVFFDFSKRLRLYVNVLHVAYLDRLDHLVVNHYVECYQRPHTVEQQQAYHLYRQVLLHHVAD